jgi:polysaccharide export outer membrane protein
MIELWSLKRKNFPQLNGVRSSLRAFFLPLTLLTLVISCGGGAKSVATPGPMTEGTGGSGTPEEKPHIVEFILGPGDELAIRVWGHDDLNRKIRLDASGEFYYPFVGYVNASGMDIREMRQTINDGLSRYYVNPQVGVEVISLRSQKIFVLGEVTKPGVFLLDGANTAIEAISKAGGFTNDATKSSVILIRGDLDNPELRRLNLEEYLTKARAGENIYLEAGDVLYVPRSFIGDVREFFKTMQIVMRPIVLLERAIVLEPRAEDVFLE